MIHHAPFTVFLTVLLIAVGFVVVIVASSRVVRGHLPRLVTSLGIGAVIAAALTAYVSRTWHTAHAALATGPHPAGEAGSLTAGFTVTMLIGAVIVFAVLTLAARRSAARRRMAEQAERSGRARTRASAWR